MAEVTGFTSQRMKQIEDTTVVDGEVVGDNLHLLQRNGTPIDAGNVRGPKGDQGVAGPVQSVNDQTGAAYAPRIFATKALLDGWTTAPVGAFAVTTDSESTWEKTSVGWICTNISRIYPDGNFSSRWPNAPTGATVLQQDTQSELYKSPAAWQYANPFRIFGSAEERDARWPNAVDGSFCICGPTIYMKRAGIWTVFPHQQMHVETGQMPVYANQWNVVGNFGHGPAGYRVLMTVNATCNVGGQAGPTVVYNDFNRLTDGLSLGGYTGEIINSGMFVSASFHKQWIVEKGQNTGFQIKAHPSGQNEWAYTETNYTITAI